MSTEEPSILSIADQLNFHLTKVQKTHLVPFFASWLTYYLLYMPVWGYPPQTLGSLVFKLIPIFSLCFFVISGARGFRGLPTNKEDMIPDDDRTRYFLFALVCSSLGDACLVFRHALFIPGLIFFACAHVLYLFGLKDSVKPQKSRTNSLFALLAINTFLFVNPGIDSYIMTFFVALYVVLIFSVAWYATARYEIEGNKSALVGCVGALVFVFSDLVLATDRWIITVPFSGSIVMSSYFLAQMCLALSTIKDLN